MGKKNARHGLNKKLLHGKIKLWDIPETYRPISAYIIAIRNARYTDGTEADIKRRKNELREIENLMLEDIARVTEQGKQLKRLHDSYFESPHGFNHLDDAEPLI